MNKHKCNKAETCKNKEYREGPILNKCKCSIPHSKQLRCSEFKCAYDDNARCVEVKE